MSDKDKHSDTPEPETMIEKPRKLIEQQPEDNIQHGRNAQRPEVNPSTVQPGHRDREEV